jgi:hypothetical protein
LAWTGRQGVTGSFVTVITSINPETVNKHYTLGPNGKLQKTAVAHISEGLALCHEVRDADAMAALLRQVTQSTNQVICPGKWHGCDGSPFHIFSERALAEMLGKPVGSPELAGVHEHDGKRVAARLKRGIYPSWWLLLDADSPPGMPATWAAMSMQERAELLELILPGLSKCERVELRGSSSRVHCVDEEPGPASRRFNYSTLPMPINAVACRPLPGN